MGEKISFPKNHERHLELGRIALAEDRQEEAVYHLEKAYELQQLFSTNYLLAHTLYVLGQYSSAKEYADEMESHYYQEVQHTVFFINVLLANKEFIKCGKVIKRECRGKEYKELRIELDEKLVQAENFYRKYHRKEIKDVIEKLSSVEISSFFSQFANTQSATILPREEFISLVKLFLISSGVHILLKASLLEELSQLGVKEDIEYLAADNKRYTVCPEAIGNIVDASSYKLLMNFIEEETADQDPILFHTLKEEIRLHFAIMYPFANQIVRDPRLWTIGYITSYSPEMRTYKSSPELSDEIAGIKQIQKKMRSVLDQISLENI